MPLRTVSRILHGSASGARRAGPEHRRSDPSSSSTAVRHGRDELVDTDVEQLEKIPDGAGRRVHDRECTPTDRKTKVGHDSVHSPIDDHSTVEHAEALEEEKKPFRAAFSERAIADFTVSASLPSRG